MHQFWCPLESGIFRVIRGTCTCSWQARSIFVDLLLTCFQHIVEEVIWIQTRCLWLPALQVCTMSQKLGPSNYKCESWHPLNSAGWKYSNTQLHQAEKRFFLSAFASLAVGRQEKSSEGFRVYRGVTGSRSLICVDPDILPTLQHGCLWNEKFYNVIIYKVVKLMWELWRRYSLFKKMISVDSFWVPVEFVTSA